jgi:hypothetical protein
MVLDDISAESMSPERLMYLEQDVNKLDEEGKVYLGIPRDKISKEFIETVKSRAIYLGLECMEGNYMRLNCGVQAGIVIDRDGIPRLVMAKHNLMS